VLWQDSGAVLIVFSPALIKLWTLKSGVCEWRESYVSLLAGCVWVLHETRSGHSEGGLQSCIGWMTGMHWEIEDRHSHRLVVE